MRKIVVFLTFLLFSISMIYSVIQKEETLKYGKVLRLKLVPVDPRSLMQGDYMRLNFELNTIVNKELLKISYLANKLVVKLDENNIGIFKRFFKDKDILKDKEIVLNFTYIKGEGYAKSKVSTTSYFFEEGTAKRYENAKYGEFRVSDNGEMILVYLLDEKFDIIKKGKS